MTKFINWCENIINHNVDIFYPKNDQEIKNIIEKAHYNSKKIRVTAQRHSQSPVVCNSDEELYLIDLKKYKLEPKNFSIKKSKKGIRVTVNAGWTLGHLYDK